MLKLTISRYTTKTINTSKGESLKCNFNAGGLWYNAWVGSWNQHWQNGTVVEIEESRIESNNYKGKNYLNIKAPPKSSQSNQTGQTGQAAQQQSPESKKNEERIVKALEVIYLDLQDIKKFLKIPPRTQSH